MSNKKELDLNELENANGGGNLFSDSIEEARTKYKYAVGDNVDVSLGNGTTAKGKVEKRGIGLDTYGGCTTRYDNYYLCNIPNRPDRRGWYLSPENICTRGPKDQTDINLVEIEG